MEKDGISSTNRPTREKAVGELARLMFEKLEHLDPISDREWDDLDDDVKEIYRTCVDYLGAHGSLLSALIE